MLPALGAVTGIPIKSRNVHIGSQRVGLLQECTFVQPFVNLCRIVSKLRSLRHAGLDGRHTSAVARDDGAAGFIGECAGVSVAEVAQRHGPFEHRGIRAPLPAKV